MEIGTIYPWNQEQFTHGTRNQSPMEPGNYSLMEPGTIYPWNQEPFTHGTRNHLSKEPGTIYPRNPGPFTRDILDTELVELLSNGTRIINSKKLIQHEP